MVLLEFFIDINLPAETMALGSIDPLTEMSTRKSGSLKLLEPSGPVQACNEIALSLHAWDELRISMHCSHHERNSCGLCFTNAFNINLIFSSEAC